MEYSITGFSHSATTSRMMWMASASSRCRWVRWAVVVLIGKPETLGFPRGCAYNGARSLADPCHAAGESALSLSCCGCGDLVHDLTRPSRKLAPLKQASEFPWARTRA